MAETPNPTLEELADADALVNGDIALAQDEIVRRLRLNLPGWIEAVNLARGWSGPDAMVQPADYAIAPAVLTDAYLNQILVSVRVQTTPQGIGGVFRNEGDVTITSIDARIESGEQVRLSWARAEAIRAVLYPFLSGCRNAEDQQCWRMLEPTSYSILPSDWAKHYSGTAVCYRLVQSPR